MILLCAISALLGSLFTFLFFQHKIKNIEEFYKEIKDRQLTMPKQEERKDSTPPNIIDVEKKESQQESQSTYERIIELIKEKRLYLDPNIQSKEIAKQLGISARSVTEAIHSNNNGESYKSIINRFRIEYAVSIIDRHLYMGKQDELSSICGFSSRVTFWRAFQKYKGCSPLDYITRNK